MRKFSRGLTKQKENNMPSNELTWDEVKTILQIADSMRTYTAWDEIDYPDEKKYYEEVLRRFNEAKNEA